MNNLTLGSLFDGSGGFPLGAFLSSITPVWASEIEPFPIRVTTKRLPNVEHLGDISALDGGDLTPVDIITFGSPCTDLSVAGKRAGLSGKQSNLFFQAIRVIREMRCATSGKYPRFIVWENVPGALSSNGGEDFRCVLQSICEVKEAGLSVPRPEKWQGAGSIVGEDFSIAWRTLDAQFWGVPQRRKRIYLVADFAGSRAGEILFESEGLSGYSPQSFGAWQRAARGAAACAGEGCLCLNDQGGSRMDVTEDFTCTLRAESHHPPIVIENHPSDSRVKIKEDSIVQTLASNMGTGGGNVPLTLKVRCGCQGGGKGALIQENQSATLSCNNDQTVFVPYGISSHESNAMKSDNPHSGIYEAETARTLDAGGGNPACNQGGIAICVQGSVIGRKEENGPQGSGVNEETAFSLNTIDRHAVVYGIDRAAFNQGKNALYNFAVEEELEPTLVAKGPGAVAEPIYCASKASFFMTAEKELANTLVATDYKDPPLINEKDDVEYLVRRLTPTECARLQGFPDFWCADLGTENPTTEEIRWWADVFETHRKLTQPHTKPKSERQIIKWLKNPHSDCAEYKMWGNGVALPNVVFVLSGIAWAANLPLQE